SASDSLRSSSRRSAFVMPRTVQPSPVSGKPKVTGLGTRTAEALQPLGTWNGCANAVTRKRGGRSSCSPTATRTSWTRELGAIGGEQHCESKIKGGGIFGSHRPSLGIRWSIRGMTEDSSASACAARSAVARKPRTNPTQRISRCSRKAACPTGACRASATLLAGYRRSSHCDQFAHSRGSGRHTLDDLEPRPMPTRDALDRQRVERLWEAFEVQRHGVNLSSVAYTAWTKSRVVAATFGVPIWRITVTSS